MKIDQIDKNEALRYLGYKGQRPEKQVTALLDLCEKKLLSVIKPVYLYRIFSISTEEKGIRIADSDVYLSGSSAAKHLDGCHSIALMCASLGAGTDLLLRQLQISDMSAAVVTDALSNAAIEQLCDMVQSEILEKTAPVFHTYRYSPGYGDLPLEIQPRLLHLLDAPKKAGLCATDKLLLTPAKSVTAFIGLSDNEIKAAARGCECCNMKNTCAFRNRKNGGHCGY